MSLHVLREKDRNVYVVWIDTDYSEPIVRRHWYPTGIKAYIARQNLGENWEGTELRDLGDGRCEIPPAAHTYSGRGIVVEMIDRGRTKADLIDQFEVLPPKTRRKGEIFWRHGEWWISGPRGDEILAKVNLHDYVTP